MKIDDALKERLLTADRVELKRLAMEQPELAPLVARLLGAEGDVREWLEATPDLAVARSTTRPDTRDRARFRPWAAAAAVVALGGATYLATAFRSAADPAASASAPEAMGTAATLDLEAESDFVVFPTDNPDFAIIWLLNGDE